MIRAGLALTLGFGMLCMGCESAETLRRLDRIESKQRRVEQSLSVANSKMETVDKLGHLAADLEAVKAYFKDVSDKARVMRQDMVTVLDEQNVRIEEGRRQYVSVLKRQSEMLNRMQQEIGQALKELEKKAPEADRAISAEVPQPKLSP